MLYLTPPRVNAKLHQDWQDEAEMNLKGKPMLLAASQLTLLLSMVWACLLSCL